MRSKMPERFWAQVDKSDPEGCWPWTGGMGRRNGYGVYSHKYAHRVAYELTVGPIPSGLHLLHSCDNPPCCNPAHLTPGTQAQNMGEAAAKGRMASGTRTGWVQRSVQVRPNVRAASTHCWRGHERTEANSYLVLSRNGKRYPRCRTCTNEYMRERRSGLPSHGVPASAGVCPGTWTAISPRATLPATEAKP